MKARLELTEEEYRLFSERVAKSLAEHPLSGQTRAQREQVAELYRQLGEATYYHLLGIDPGSGMREVHDAYERVARQIHPSHARRLGLEGKDDMLKILFERVTLAYLTLSDTERRKAYDRQVGPARWTALHARSATREEDRRRVLDQARSLAAAEQFHSAIELLRRAVLKSPDADTYALLGLLQAKNPQWAGEALENLERALEMGTTEPAVAEAIEELRRTGSNP